MIGQRRYFSLPVVIFTCLAVFFYHDSAQAETCQKAVLLYNQAVNVVDLRQKELLYSRALALGCDDQELTAKIHNNLADTYERQGELDTAIAEYQKAIECHPFLPTPYFSLAEIYSKLNRPKKATHYHEKGFLLNRYMPPETIVASLSPSRAVRLQPQVTLYFGFDRSDLNEAAKRQLRSLEQALKNRELLIYRFRIDGHTCNLGSTAYNQTLSEFRAETVRKWLVRHGILKDRLITQGFGEGRPVADNNGEEGRMRNRRVNIVTIGVAMLSVPINARSPGQKEALHVLRAGERLLMLERYEEAVEQFIRAKNAFENERFRAGVKAALKDLTLAYRFLEDWEKAEHYRRQLEAEGTP
jgi:outer membrane protein OmpA-like peptidoglycan-associated protein